MSRPRKKFKDTKVGQFLLGKKGLFSELANTILDNGVLGVIKRLIVNEDSLSVNDKSCVSVNAKGYNRNARGF